MNFADLSLIIFAEMFFYNLLTLFKHCNTLRIHQNICLSTLIIYLNMIFVNDLSILDLLGLILYFFNKILKLFKYKTSRMISFLVLRNFWILKLR